MSYFNGERIDEPNELDYRLQREPEISFTYEHVPSKEELMKQIDECEGKHTQQAIYSTFHSAITQVCFGCMMVRSTIRR